LTVWTANGIAFAEALQKFPQAIGDYAPCDPDSDEAMSGKKGQQRQWAFLGVAVGLAGEFRQLR
jgi:hypothetical protein